MDQTAKLKAALKAEIRKTIKESQESTKLKQGDKITIVSKLGNIVSRGLEADKENFPKPGDQYEILGIEDSMYGFKDLKGNKPDLWYQTNWIDKELSSGSIKKEEAVNGLAELARVATVIKIGNKKAAEAYVLANKGKWVSDMVQAVIDAGDAGITQPALATAIGKGSQQTINPKVREFITAGVFVQGESGVKTAQPKQEPKVKPVVKPSKPVAKSDDEDEDEFTDDFEKSDAEDDAPEDEDALAAKATPNKGVQSDAKKLDQVLIDMKKLAADYKVKKGTPDGDVIVAKLKDLNKEKTKLEKIVHKALGDEDNDLLDTTND